MSEPTVEPAIDLGDGKTAVVEFSYGEKMLTHLRRPHSQPHYETKCRISIRMGITEIDALEASSYCSPDDRFNMAFGRKFAIAKIFKSDPTKSRLSREQRTKIAQQYIVPALAQMKPVKTQKTVVRRGR